MKDSLPIAISLVALAIFVFVSSQLNPAHAQPPLVTPALLDLDPDLWIDQEVRVRTAGMETGDNEFIYRKIANQPPLVILRFKGKAPDKLPEFLIGTCRGRHGATVIVENCH